jgi:hypothetical protein
LATPASFLAPRTSSNGYSGFTSVTASPLWSPFINTAPLLLPWIGPPDSGLADCIRRSTCYSYFCLPLGRRVFDVVRRYRLSALYVLAFMRLPSDHTTDSRVLVSSVNYIKIHISIAFHRPLPVSLFRREHLPEMDGAWLWGVPVDILALRASSNTRPGVTLLTASHWWSPFIDAVPPQSPGIDPPDCGLADRIR